MTPRKNESKFKLPKYDYLYILPDRPGLYYKRWSPEKRKAFTYSTGLDDPREASKIGKAKFDEWLGIHIAESGERLIRDLGKAVLVAKESCKGGKLGASYRQAELQMRHVNNGFGHLRPDQVTSHKWDLYDIQERKRVYYREGNADPKTGKREKIPYHRTTTNHTREFLMETLILARDKGMIRTLPVLKKHDPPADPPRVIPRETVLALIRSARRPGRLMKLLVYMMWKQGARPLEVLQYRWDMVKFDEGPHGSLHIPAAICKNPKHRVIPLNSRVSRLLRRIRPLMTSDYLFPSPRDPGRPSLSYKTAWRSACRRVGVDFELYNLRDTFISNQLRKGKSSDYLAHYVQNSPEMIRRRYAVFFQEGLREVAE